MWMFSAWRSTPAAGGDLDLSSVDFYSLHAQTAEGKEKQMSDYKGKVLLITNTATKCGYTPQHLKEFKELKDKYGEDGFEILAFPTLQFKQQEEKDAATMCLMYKKYNFNFDLFAITEVNGKNSHPIFQYCKYHSEELYNKGSLQPIGWNFGKFLLDRDAKVVKYFGPRTSPQMLQQYIEAILKGELKGRKRNAQGVLE